MKPLLNETSSKHGMRCWGAGQTGKPVENWDEIKIKVMLEVNRAKYREHEDLRIELLTTGTSEIVGV